MKKSLFKKLGGLFLGLAMGLGVAVGVTAGNKASEVGAAEKTITIDRSSYTGSKTTYGLYDVESNDIAGKMYFYPSEKNCIQSKGDTNNGKALYYNTDPIPGPIKSIKMTGYKTTYRNHVVYISTKPLTASNYSSDGKQLSTQTNQAGFWTSTETNWITNAKYIYIWQSTTSASYTSKIEITYTEESAASVSSIKEISGSLKGDVSTGWDTSGLTVVANLSDNNTKDITADCTLVVNTPIPTSASSGTASVTATYTKATGISKTQDVSYVVTKKHSGLSIAEAFSVSEAIDHIKEKDLVGTTTYYVTGIYDRPFIDKNSVVQGHYIKDSLDDSLEIELYKIEPISSDEYVKGNTIIAYATGSLYQLYSSTYELNNGCKLVETPKLNSIVVKTAPKTVYTEGETFNPTGLVITKKYTAGGSDVDVAYSNDPTGFTFVPSTSTALSMSDTSVSITYEEKTVNLPITVESSFAGDFSLDKSSVSGYPGQNATVTASNATGFSGTVTYTWSSNDESVATVSSSTGASTTINYVAAGGTTIKCVASDGTNTKTHEVTVTVNADTIQSITIGGDMSVKTYDEKGSWKYDGLTATAAYASGKTEDVTGDTTFEAATSISVLGVGSNKSVTINATHTSGKTASKIITGIEILAHQAINFTQYTANTLVEGDYVIGGSDNNEGYFMKAEVESSRLADNDFAVTYQNGVVEDPADSLIWHITIDGDNFRMYNKTTESYASGGTVKNSATLLTNSEDTHTKWKINDCTKGVYDLINVGRSTDSSDPSNKYLRCNSSSSNRFFAAYGSGTGTKVLLYKAPVMISSLSVTDGSTTITNTSATKALTLTDKVTTLTVAAQEGAEESFTIDSLTNATNLSMTDITGHPEQKMVTIGDLTQDASGTFKVHSSLVSLEVSLSYSAPKKTISKITVSKEPTKTGYAVGETFDPAGIEIEVEYTNSTLYPNETVVYSDETKDSFSFNPAVGTVFSLGEEETSKQINLYVYYTYDGVTVSNGQKKITITKEIKPVSDMTLGSNIYLDLYEHGTSQIEPDVTPKSATDTTVSYALVDTDVTYKASDYIAVDQNGNVSMKSGVTLPASRITVYVAVTTNGVDSEGNHITKNKAIYLVKHTSPDLSVAEKNGETITDLSNFHFEYGKTYVFTAEDEYFADEQDFDWSIGNGSSYAEIKSTNGNTAEVYIKGVSGSTQIKVQAKVHESQNSNIAATSVYQATSSVTIDQGDSVSLDYGKSQTFTASVEGEFANPNVTWSTSSATLVAGEDYFWDDSTHTLTADVVDGSVTVTATSADGESDSCIVDISYTPVLTQYTKVTSLSELTDDNNYLIVCEGKSLVMSQASKTDNTAEVTINEDGTITATEDLAKCHFTVHKTAEGKFSFAGPNGYYINHTADANDMTVSETEISNTVSFNEGGTVNLVGTGGCYLRYNTSAGYFRYYKSSTYTGQAAVSIYKLSEGKSAESFAESFNKSITNVCDYNGGTSTTELKSAWEALATEYSSLDVIEKKRIAKAEANSAGNDIEKMLSAYEYIYAKYGSSLSLEDFLASGLTSGAKINNPIANLGNVDNSVWVISAVALVGLTAIGGYFFYRKRKEI